MYCILFAVIFFGKNGTLLLGNGTLLLGFVGRGVVGDECKR